MYLIRRSGHVRPPYQRTEVEGTPTASYGDANIQKCNDLLHRLSEIYPEHNSYLIRQAILEAPEKHDLEISRFEVAADALGNAPLIRNGDLELRCSTQRDIEPWECFRTEAYKAAVSEVLTREFQWLKGSAIRAVLAENNYDYFRCKESLSRLNTRSWRVKIASFFTRKPAATLSTGCAELDQEIKQAQTRREREEQLEADRELARTINEEQYDAVDALFECQCCFGDFAWEDACFCPDMHCFCRRCLKSSVEGSLYNQASGIDYAKGSVRCISSTANPACVHSVSPNLLPFFLPRELMAAFDDHLAKRALDSSGAPSLRCPFCSYAVVDGDADANWGKAVVQSLPSEGVFLWLLLSFANALRWVTVEYILPAIARVWLWTSLPRANVSDRPRWATILRCMNPRCGRHSCLKCGKEWIGIHDCTQTEAEQKRAYVSRRMDEALKRTCPLCHTSFLKDGGCNKMTCPCGYKMCYLCRADLRVDQYAHFCSHFRMIPGTGCKECTKCLLYAEEVPDDVLKAAQTEAEAEWERRRRE